MDIILRVGWLHADTSFLGAIGQLIGGAGLQYLLAVIYAVKAVGYILTGNASSQAIHGHILIEAVLYAIILYKIYKVPLPFKEKEGETIRNRSEKMILYIRLITTICQKRQKSAQIQQMQFQHLIMIKR